MRPLRRNLQRDFTASTYTHVAVATDTADAVADATVETAIADAENTKVDAAVAMKAVAAVINRK